MFLRRLYSTESDFNDIRKFQAWILSKFFLFTDFLNEFGKLMQYVLGKNELKKLGHFMPGNQNSCEKLARIIIMATEWK